ncbi:OmpA family protein [Agaribacterium haliotis]|uniref:OmpA family protein n=1 Tax=Agaribacterium haliotis TaxID=2013869 RepID=UPI001304670A|nr:OmpA family protein [Agaribacterium haliotis]
MAALFVPAACLCAPVNAADIYVVPNVSYQWLDDSGHIDSAPAVGLSGGLRLGERWALELGALYGESKTVFGDDTSMRQWAVEGQYLFEPGSRFQPYGLISLGRLDFAAEQDDELTSAIGAGSYYQLSERVKLRADLRSRYSWEKQLVDIAATAGFSFSFGSGTASASKTYATKSSATAPQRPSAPAQSAAGLKAGDDSLIYHFEIHFEFNSAALLPQYQDDVAGLAEFLKQHPDADLQVTGFSDDQGPEAYNLTLSEKRAQLVVDILAEDYGIERSRMSAVGRGEAEPMASNRTAAGRAKNRRDIAIIKAHVGQR